MKRDKQKRPAHITRDLQVGKETCKYEKRPANMKTGLCFERTMKRSVFCIIGNPHI